MREPWLTLTAGLVSGAALLTFLMQLVVGGHEVVLPAGAFYVAATSVLALVRPRPRSVLLVWAAAACFVAAITWSPDEQELWGNVILSSAVLGTLLAVPWLVATGALRLLLADPATQPSYDLDHLHS